MAHKKRVLVIGAGPGGLSAAMILAHRGFDVTVIEKKGVVGGRNAALRVGDYVFDTGPTFVMLPQVFRDIFTSAGKNMDEYVTFLPLDPLYRLQFEGKKSFHVFFDKKKLKAEIERHFPGESAAYDRYFIDQKKKFERLFEALKVPYTKPYHYLRKELLKTLPYLDAHVSVYDVLSRYFQSPDLKIAMAFQAKYLGMSPWDCPGAFTIISYIEHAYGIHHPKGGVFQISEGMARAAQENGAVIRLNTGVARILMDGSRVKGVELEDGEQLMADAVVMNADFAHGMLNLLEEKERPRYTDAKLEAKDYSCSTFMLYLGVKKQYPLTHHSIILSKDYHENVDDIFQRRCLSKDPSFYIQNACVTDQSLAPEGKSTVYVLVPVPNLKGSSIDWRKEAASFRDLILDKIEEKTEMSDIREQIEVERVITPLDWQQSAMVHEGAVFNLSHSFGQMLYMRPQNKLVGYQNLYLVGGGTHPGSGLPTIVQSGQISADLLTGDLG